MGVVIPHNLRKCSEYSKKVLCNNCVKIVNQLKEFLANLNEKKKKTPDKNSYMLPWFKNFWYDKINF